jgi:hypothetical protein
VLFSSFRPHPVADLIRLWEVLHGGKVYRGLTPNRAAVPTLASGIDHALATPVAASTC